MEQFLKLPPMQRALVLLALLGVMGAGGYFLLIDPELTRLGSDERLLRGAQAELSGIVAVAKPEELVRLRRVKDALVEAEKENRKLLPTAAEIPDLIETLQRDAIAANLAVSRFDRLDTVHLDLVDAIPVRVTVTGSLIDFIRFLRTYAGSSRRLLHLRKLSVEVVPPELAVVEAEYRKSLPPERQAVNYDRDPDERRLLQLEVLALARKKSVVRVTFIAHAYLWTGKPAPDDGKEPEEGKRKRT